ncbi:hypothetical protein [Parasphingopyxis marina]|uniref:Terminase small subunit n=1 Tax=Parasphingopyxis marina TaxID=2761622 RepID=A0A842I0G0_9SPHN|nr:hypothetical protein [Parasphingopyxis marina]MBC2778327.1 hypothetical protein [Parasphingopyxis marina]
MARTQAATRLARNHTGDAPGRAQLRAVRHDGWTEKRREIFLETLAATCNITAAAAEAGKTAKTARDLRKRDPAFRQAWDEAIAIAYERLELVMLDRAINGTQKPIVRGDKEVATMTHYSDAAGLRLLQAHRETALRHRDGDGRACDPEEAFEELKRRLDEMHRRLKREEESGASDG